MHETDVTMMAAVLVGPADPEIVGLEARLRAAQLQVDVAALDALYAVSGGYPYFVQAYGKVTWDAAPGSPITAEDVKVAAPNADAELAVGFFGSRYERATVSERQYMRAMAATGDDPVPTSVVADELGRKPSSLSPARDGLIKKGLIYSSERGLIAFTVPHFGKFLRSQPV